jgi:3-deoxy-D-manno-octulosonic-acid transferase
VFIGGSLIERGGHSPLEAMRFGKPIQSGPHVFNFEAAYRGLDEAQALSWTPDAGALAASTAAVLSDAAVARAQGAAAEALYRLHGGASERMVQAIAALLGPQAGDFRVHAGAGAGAGTGELRWFDRSVFDTMEELSFSPAHWQQRKAVIGRSQGRRTAFFVRHGTTSFVLRHYYRGGWVGKWIDDRFLAQPPARSRAMREFSLLRHMRGCDLPVPRPLAARYRREGWTYQADLIVERVPGSTDLARMLADGGSLSADRWRELGALIARFHRHGVDHADLNCRNILLDGQGRFWLIDFDKCSVRAPGPWREGNLARLLRSLEKERRLDARFGWHAPDWAHVMEGYGQARPA